MKYKGVIFDLDGVICSTDEYHYLAWKALADRLCIPFDLADNNRMRGIGRMESLEIVLEKSPVVYFLEEKISFAAEKNEFYRRLLNEMGEKDLADEVKETLFALREMGLKLAIGSSSRNTSFILERIGLGDFFDTVVDGNSITHSKPHPEVFLKAANRLGLAPSACLVVEDARAGVEAAAAGGFDCAALGDAKDEPRAKWRLDRFFDLIKSVNAYVCDDGFKLGSWICRLKDRRAGKNGLQPLTEEQIARLDRIGMVWVSKFDDQWENAYAEARKWFEKNGSLEVPIACEVNGIRLGRWAARQRDSFEKGKLSAERKQRLDAIGMTWKQDDSWETSFREAEKYYRQHGKLEVPAKYVDSNGSWLGRWISAQRKDCRDGNLSGDRFERLNRIGMRWQSTAEIRWEQMYRQLAEYVRLHGNLKTLAEDANEKQLSLWYRRQRPKERDGKLTRQQEEQLSALGM